MSSLSLSNSHEQRLEERSVANAHGQIVSDRTYNMVLGLTVLWGLRRCAVHGGFCRVAWCACRYHEAVDGLARYVAEILIL